MRTFLFLGSGGYVLASLRDPAEDWALDHVETWSDAVRRLTSQHPPDVLLFTTEHLTEQAFRAVVGLRKKGFFVPAAVYLGDATLEQVHAAGRLHRHGVDPIFGPAALGSGVAQLMERAAPVVRGRIAQMLGVSGGMGERLLALLDGDPGMLTATPDRLARSLGTSRSGLYRGLRSASLPPPGALQALFRLWPGLLRIASGGRGEDAAFEAGCPHYLAFRRAVATHFGLTIRDVREMADPHALLQRWALHQARVVSRASDPPSMRSRAVRRGWRIPDGELSSLVDVV